MIVYLKFLLLFAMQNVLAHFAKEPPLHFYDFVDSPMIEVFSESWNSKHSSPEQNRVSHYSAYRLSFKAFNRTYFLHMQPNLDLFHSDTFKKSEDIPVPLPFLVKAYKGAVHKEEDSLSILQSHKLGLLSKKEGFYNTMGLARITLHDDGTVMHSPKISEKNTFLSPSLKFQNPKFEGVFTYNDEMFHIKDIDSYKSSKSPEDPEVTSIESRSTNLRGSNMIVYRNEDYKPEAAQKEKERVCGNNGHPEMNGPMKKDQSHPSFRLYKRQTSASCNGGEKKIAYVGVAADCTYVSQYRGVEKAAKQIVTDLNQASLVYESTFNIQLAIGKLNILSECVDDGAEALQKPQYLSAWNRECTQNYQILNRLSDFSAWRGTQQDQMAVWVLMTRCSSDTTLGIAWTGQICRKDAQNDPSGAGTISGTAVVSVGKDEWKVVTHEIGHVFGAIHDCTDTLCKSLGQNTGPSNTNQCCPCDSACSCGGTYIMNPTNNFKKNSFSPCSTKDICLNLIKNGQCLVPASSANIKPLSDGMCGNGIKEGNEQCDCGTPDECQNDPCCTSDCRLKNNAVCSDKNQPCCVQCKFKTSGSVCHNAKSECDSTIMCTGTSAECPINMKPDGTKCGSSGNTCASGYCTSRDLQCQNRGADIKTKGDCSDTNNGQCDMYCSTADGKCTKFDGFYLDGTPCGYNGFCYQGVCSTNSIGDAVISWMQANTAIAIAIVIGAIILLLVITFVCCRCLPCCRSSHCCCCRSRKVENESNYTSNYSKSAFGMK